MSENYDRLKTASRLKNWIACNYTNINEINKTRTANIITVEDPVEFIHKDIKSIISHREVGKQTQTFASALKAALREDPDVILVGEMRDLETVGLALSAAEKKLAQKDLKGGTDRKSGVPLVLLAPWPKTRRKVEAQCMLHFDLKC